MKTASSAARKLSHQLRSGDGGFLHERRAIAVLSLAAVGAMGLITLYQLGVLKHLAEPHLAGLDADRIDASPEAYKRFHTPDAALGVLSYSTTLALAAAGGKNRARKNPWLALAFGAKVGFDTFQGLRLAVVQWTKFRAFCFWCLLAASSTFAMVPFVARETRAALRTIKETRRGFLHRKT